MNDQSLRVLIIEDSENDALLIIRELKKGGYNPVYERIETAAAMKKALKEKQWDIILCDYKMPKFNAPSAIAILKKANIDIPIIIVSGSIGEETAVECMRLGAQDYIMKGNMSRLCPAITRELEDAEVRNKEKHAEEKLRHEEQRFQSLAEQSSDVIIFVNREGTITYENQAIERTLGFKPEERIGAKGFELIHPNDLKFVTDAFNRLFRDIKAPVTQTEVRLRHKDGNWRTFEVVASNLVHDNFIESVIVNLRDITERKKVEEALKKSEDQYRLLADNITEHVWLMDLNTKKTIYVSPSVEKMYGYTSDEIIKISLKKILTPESLQKMRDAFSTEMPKALVNPLPYVHTYSLELQAYHKDGHLLWIENALSVIRDENGKPALMLGETRDITERKQAEEALHESEYKYKSLIDNVPDVIFTIDLEGKITFVSKRAKEISGYENAETINRNIFNFIPEEYHQITMENLQKGMKGEKIKHIQMPMIAKSGEKLFFDFSFTRIYKNGVVVGAQGTAVDITERKKAEELLKESEAHYRLLADHMKDQVWIMDLDLKVTYTSPSVEKLLGYTLKELRQLPLDKLLTPTSYLAAMDFFSIEMSKALAAPPTYSLRRLLELECRCKDGRTLWLESSFSFIRDENGKPVFILGEGRDITERKQIEYDLRASEINFRHSLDDSPLGVRISTTEGETIYANRAILDIYGYDSIEELKKIHLKERYTPESYAEFLLRKEKRLRGEFGPSEYEISIVRKNGEIRHLYVFRKEIFWNGKKQSQVIYQDITLRRQAEKTLRETLENLRKSIKTTIQVLGMASEARDPYTAGHQRRVADLAHVIATEMGLPHDTIEGIRMAGSIHDIGKLSIPAEILSKPTKLTNIEFSLIKEHPQIGYEMLKDMESSWPLAQIVHQHHERMNGSGYPRNLKGDEIIIEARIMAVADVMEAMASHRPYRPGFGIEAALAEIEKNKAILYDDTVADTCLRLFREKDYQLI